MAFYGTLKGNPVLWNTLGILNEIVPIGQFGVAGSLGTLGPYPALFPGEEHIACQVVKISSARAMAVLDEYEVAFPEKPAESLYVRKLIEVIGYEHRAWIYLANQLDDLELNRILNAVG